MTDQHSPITPPPELVDLIDSWAEAEVAKKALKWAAPILRQQGADQELEACCQALYNRFASPGHQAQVVAQEMRDWLRATRRSKPPSLKEQALEAFNRLSALALQEYEGCEIHKEYAEMADQVRHGLKQLPD